jgi:hypothetical protein
MMEKTNSAEAISGCVFPGEAGERTFSEVPDPKNVDERDEEAEYSSITSLMLVLLIYPPDQVHVSKCTRNAHTLSSQKVIRMVAAVTSTGMVILREGDQCGTINIKP